MKKLCDGNIERFVRNEYYDLLAPLSPTERFVKKFDLMLLHLRSELRDDDEFFGWFLFDEKCENERLFPDEELPEELQKAEKRMLSFGTRSKVDRGHTLVNYEKILRHGLSHYESEIEHELAALISTYLQRGGLQFQVNAASSKTLRAAYENPEAYPHLIVRVGGFSLYFNTLPDNAKLEFIERFEMEGT